MQGKWETSTLSVQIEHKVMVCKTCNLRFWSEAVCPGGRNLLEFLLSYVGDNASGVYCGNSTLKSLICLHKQQMSTVEAGGSEKHNLCC